MAEGVKPQGASRTNSIFVWSSPVGQWLWESSRNAASSAATGTHPNSAVEMRTRGQSQPNVGCPFERRSTSHSAILRRDLIRMNFIPRPGHCRPERNLMGHSIARDLGSISRNSSLMCVSEQEYEGDPADLFTSRESQDLGACCPHPVRPVTNVSCFKCTYDSAEQSSEIGYRPSVIS